MGQVVKGQGYKAPTRTNTPAPKPAAKKPVKPVASKPVTSTTTPRTRGGVSKGNTPGVGSKRKALADIKARANERLATEKAAAEKAPKANLKRTPRVTAVQRSGKPAPGPKAGQRIVKVEAAAKALKNAKLAKAGKVGLIAGTVAAGYTAKKLYDYATGSDNKPKKNAKKSERTDTLIKTPSLKDELKKRGVDTKPVKDNPKTNWLDTAKKGNTLKYGIDAPKSKKYEAPTMVKADTKKAETKPVVKTPPVKKPTTTPKATTPKVSTTVDKMEMKPTAPIATDLESKKEIVQPKAAATTPSASLSTSSSTTPSNSASTPKTQPRATFGNKIRGALNESRERRAGRAASRGNEDRSERLKEKISDTEKKMMMRKGGVVKKTINKSKKK
jgi:hypothetical protein